MSSMTLISQLSPFRGTTLVVLALFSGQLFVSAGTGIVRGVAPNKLAMYTGARFRCLRDHHEMAADRVNDDVCDCEDGSDEPGTSACANGTFYCTNKGFRAKEISSSFVDDGVCDCCDGSDEDAGCNNTCQMLRQLEKKELQDKMDRYEAGAVARAQLVTEASKKHKEWTTLVHDLTPKVKDLKAKVAALDGVIEPASEQQKNEAHRKQTEAEDALKALEKPAEEAPEDDQGTDNDNDYEEDEQEEKKEAAPAEEHPDDVGKRIAAQWTADPSAVGDDAVPQDADDGSAPGAAHDGQPVSPDKEAAGSEQEHPQSVIERLKGTVKSITTALSGSSEDSQALADAKYVVKELTEASKAAVQAHNKKSGELKDIEAQLKAAQQLLAIDYGQDGVYAGLAEHCFELEVEKYTYKVCMFVNAAQVEGRETSLGTFSECDDGCSVMKYTKGLGCWQGPARSLTVKAVCGSETQILRVTEPEKCEYVAEMATPAECRAAVVQEVRDELNELKLLAVASKEDVRDEL